MPSDGIKVPSRMIPFPKSISDKARSSLAMWAAIDSGVAPHHTDKEGWYTRIKQSEAGMLGILKGRTSALVEQLDISDDYLAGVRTFVLSPSGYNASERIILDIHGGGLTSGAGELCKLYAMTTAADHQALVYAVDYRMPPGHPYPTPLDDCFLAYRALLERHPDKNIVVRGVSAGGNLAAALALRVRDEGLPAPAGLMLLTPEVDLTESGDSFETNAFVDVVLRGSLMSANLLYANGQDLHDPYISPLFGDFSKGFPPTIISVGTRDLFLSNGVRLHNYLRRSGNYSELIIEEGMPHGGFFGAPEDEALLQDLIRFAERAWRGELAA